MSAIECDRETSVAKALDDALAKAAIERRTQPASPNETSPRTIWRGVLAPRLRLRSGCEPDYVLDLIGRDAEVRCDLGDGVTGLKPVDEILDPSAAVDDEREAECDLRVDDHLGAAVGRQPHRVGPAAASVMDAL